jgi:hypothetical protein
MVGLDSGDLLVMGGSSPFVHFRSTAIYWLSSNVWTYVAEFQKPMVRLGDPLKVGNYVFLFGHSSDNDNPFQRITLDANENVVSQ